jgi:hypothetical protein
MTVAFPDQSPPGPPPAGPSTPDRAPLLQVAGLDVAEHVDRDVA